jgi:co-chaperonin GroES (HSP10)
MLRRISQIPLALLFTGLIINFVSSEQVLAQVIAKVKHTSPVPASSVVIKKANGNTEETTWPGVNVSSGDKIIYDSFAGGPINTKLECISGKAFNLEEKDLDVKIGDLCKQ